MKYLLDTCVLSDFVKGNLNTIEKITELNPADLAISSITVMEIEYGALLAPENKSIKIKSVIDELTEYMKVISLNKEIALEAGHIRAQLHKSGTPIGYYDILIGATAKYHNLVMVTANVKEFNRIKGITIQDWRG